MRRRTADVLDRGFTHIVLVCTHDAGGEYACCADAEGEAVFEAVVRWLRERQLLWSHVYVGTSSCLALCSEHGAGITIQPRNEWYSEVRPDEVPALLERAFGARGERLVSEQIE
jgi:(2Fe-2S) ferredoxin